MMGKLSKQLESYFDMRSSEWVSGQCILTTLDISQIFVFTRRKFFIFFNYHLFIAKPYELCGKINESRNIIA